MSFLTVNDSLLWCPGVQGMCNPHHILHKTPKNCVNWSLEMRLVRSGNRNHDELKVGVVTGSGGEL